MRTIGGLRFVTAFALLGAALVGGGCAYLRNVKVQQDYSAALAQEPNLWLRKHVLERDTFFVYGRLTGDPAASEGHALAVAAVSSDLRKDEIVDVCRVARADSFYGMNLPAGKYRLLALADLNDDGAYGRGEVVGSRELEVSAAAYPAKLAGGMDLELGAAREVALASLPLALPAAPADASAQSVIYPKGAIRSLDDPIFSERMAELGMYDPAAFMEAAPLMFYALEEDRAYKVPVVFVHGIGGTPRDFEAIAAQLDRSRYRPWFFFYPSGMDLRQVASLFYDIYLSGKVASARNVPMVIVAHSMGGLVAREALNRYAGAPGEARLALLVTVATPFGGMQSARMGVEHAPLVVPSWRDLDPQGEFIARLFRRPLAPGVRHVAFYAYRKGADVARLEGGDGTVPLASQLAAPARAGFTEADGVQGEHSGVLSDPAAVARIASAIERVKTSYPPAHLRYFDMGGFEPPPGGRYSEMEKMVLRNYGYFLRALASGALAPFDAGERHFADAARGLAPATTPAETAWRKLEADDPRLAGHR